MKKTKKISSLISILILTLITVVMWVSFDVYRAIKKPTEISISAEISRPLTPSLDKDSMNQLESRALLDDSQIPDNIVSQSSVPVEQTTPSPTNIPIVEPTATPESATESGTTP